MAEISEKGGNFITILKAIPKEEVMRKQAAVRRIGESVQPLEGGRGSVCVREGEGGYERETGSNISSILLTRIPQAHFGLISSPLFTYMHTCVRAAQPHRCSIL